MTNIGLLTRIRCSIAQACKDLRTFEALLQYQGRIISNRLELVADMSLVFTDVPQGISTFYVFCISICIPVRKGLTPVYYSVIPRFQLCGGSFEFIAAGHSG